MFEYNTIATESTGIYKEKGSKFMAFAYPVETVEEIKDRLDQLRRDYHDARHHCYAYRLGYEMDVYRVNDDGEPSSTAGKPILGQMLSNELTNILIVVIRYFGGTKLGVSGLINAYRTAASEAIMANKIITKKVKDYFRVKFPYDAMNEVMRIIKDENLDASNQVFELSCMLEIAVDKAISESIYEKFTRIKDTDIQLLETK